MTGTTRTRPSRIATPLLAAALAACAGTAREAASPAAQPAVHAQGADAAVARARADSARHPYTAADVAFMQSMILHHSQAIRIAGWAPTHGAGAAVRTLAERIVNGQQDEVGTMRRWLTARRQPVPDVIAVDTTAAHGAAHAAAHGAEYETHGAQGAHDTRAPMPGMLTEAQLAQLDRARGPEFDRLFLTLMIQHHRGAVAMVKTLFGTYGAAQDQTVFKFASDVNVDQTTEIARMERMLTALIFENSSP